jgi:hypothetical protein
MLHEDVVRMKELMLLREASDPRRDAAEMFAKLLEKYFKDPQNSVDSLIKTLKSQSDELKLILDKLKRNGVKSLTDDDFIKLLSGFNPAKLSELVFDNGVIHTDIAGTLKQFSSRIKDKTGYINTIEDWKKNTKIGWGRYPNGVPDELQQFYKEYESKLITELRNEIRISNKQLWGQIANIAVKKKTINDWLNSLPADKLNLLRGAYANFLRKQDKIEDDLAAEFARINDDYIKTGGNVDFEPYAKRIIQSAISASKKGGANVKNFLDEQLSSSPLTYNQKQLLKDTDTFKLFNDVITSGDVDFKGVQGFVELAKRYSMLLNPKRFFKKMEKGFSGVSSTPAEQWQRLLNFVIQLSPYTSKENLQRISQKGIWKVTENRLLAPSIMSAGVIPATAGLYYLMVSELKEGLNMVSTEWFGGDPMFPEYAEGGSKEQDLTGYFWSGFKSAFPQKWYELIPGFGSLLDEIIEGISAADSYQGGKKITIPELESAKKAGEALLKGQEPDVDQRFLNEAEKDVRRVTERLYPDIPEEWLGEINLYPDLKVRIGAVDSRGLKRYYQLIQKNDKIFVVNTDGREQDLGKLWR